MSETLSHRLVWHKKTPDLRYNINELASVATYPSDQFPTVPFDRASDYFESVANEHLTHLRTQRSLADNAEICPPSLHRPPPVRTAYPNVVPR